MKQKHEIQDNFTEIACQHNLIGFNYYNNGKYKEALNEFHESFNLYIKLQNIQEMINVSNNLYVAYIALGEPTEAKRTQGDVLKFLRFELENCKKHNKLDDAIKILNYISEIHKNLNQNEEVSFIQKEISDLLKNSDFKNQESAMALTKTGMRYEQLGEHKQALFYYEEAFKIKASQKSNNHPDVISALNNIGIALSNLGEHKYALPNRLEVLNQYLSLYKTDRIEIADAYYNTGLQFEKLKDNYPAFQHYVKAIQMYDNLKHYDGYNVVLSAFKQIATMCEERGDFHQTYEILQLCMKYEKDASEITATRLKLAKTKYLLDEDQQGYLTECSEIHDLYKILFGEYNQETLELKSIIESLNDSKNIIEEPKNGTNNTKDEIITENSILNEKGIDIDAKSNIVWGHIADSGQDKIVKHLITKKDHSTPHLFNQQQEENINLKETPINLGNQLEQLHMHNDDSYEAQLGGVIDNL